MDDVPTFYGHLGLGQGQEWCWESWESPARDLLAGAPAGALTEEPIS